MMYTTDMASHNMIYIYLMIIGSGIQYLGYYLNSVTGCSVGTTDKKDLLCMLMR
jgi:hypothetical protein